MKTALIMCGGGMASSYSVGSILALVDKFGFTDPDIVIAGSGSAGTASYFVSRQYESIKNIWSNLLSTKKFINPLRFWRIIDIDYLIDEVFKCQDVLNISEIKKSKIDYYISATNIKTGCVEFFDARENVFEKMRATKAMPVVYRKKIEIDGEKYCDTFLSSSGIDFKINKAVELGAKKIIVLNPALYNPFAHKIFRVWARFRGKRFYRGYLDGEKFSYSLPNDVELYEIKPKEKLKIGVLDKSKISLLGAIKDGYSDVFNNKKLAKLF